MTKNELKKIEYQSWHNGNQWSDSELNFIIKNNCCCDMCDKSVCKMEDFPNLSIKDNELLCEDCYNEQYRLTCPICEESYDIKGGESVYSVINEVYAKEQRKVAGIYHNGNLIVSIKINELKKIDCGEDCCEVYSDDICPNCSSNLVRKNNFMKSHGIGTPCLLIKKYENDELFKEWTFDRLKRERQELINRRITFRGIIESSNKHHVKFSASNT